MMGTEDTADISQWSMISKNEKKFKVPNIYNEYI